MSGITTAGNYLQGLVQATQVSSAPALVDSLTNLGESLYNQAVNDIAEVASNGSYTQIQIDAMVYGAVLSRLRLVDYVTFSILYETLKKIRDERLAQAHPDNYTNIVGGEDRSFIAMAQAHGISASVASDTMMLGGVILPYAEEQLGRSKAEVWDMIGSTKLRAMIPIMRILIARAGFFEDEREENARSRERTAATVQRWAADQIGVDIEPDSRRLARMSDEQRGRYLESLETNRHTVRQWLEEQSQPSITRGVVDWMLDSAENLSNSQLNALTNTPDNAVLDAIIVPQESGTYLLSAVLTTEQREMVARVLGERIRLQSVASVAEMLRSIGLTDE